MKQERTHREKVILETKAIKKKKDSLLVKIAY